MAEPELVIVAGALARAAKPRVSQPQDALAKRWRLNGPATGGNSDRQDVIPLLEGWMRRLEREAGAEGDSAP